QRYQLLMHPVKPASARWMLLVVALVAPVLAGCAEVRARPAPFRARPDTVVSGDLRGPFDGRVVDGESDRPIAGAQVYAVWTFSGGYGFQGPAGHAEHIGVTDANGRYRVPRLARGKVP